MNELNRTELNWIYVALDKYFKRLRGMEIACDDLGDLLDKIEKLRNCDCTKEDIQHEQKIYDWKEKLKQDLIEQEHLELEQEYNH